MPGFKKIFVCFLSFFVFLVILFYAVTSYVILMYETDLVFHPHQLDSATPLELRPLILPEAENVEFLAADGKKLHGYFFQSGSYVDEKTIPVLFCHGNGGNCLYTSNWCFFTPQEADADGNRGPSKFAMLTFDYRAYGFSEGEKKDLNENAVFSDARAARSWLAQKCGKPENQIVLMGHSLGGGVVSDLAQDGTPKLLLFSTFDSVPDTALSYFPLLPTKFVMKNRFASAEKLKKISVPVLQFHAPEDATVPFRNGRRLFEVLNEPKEFVQISGMGHNYSPNPEMREKIIQFLTEEKSEPTEKTDTPKQ